MIIEDIVIRIRAQTRRFMDQMKQTGKALHEFKMNMLGVMFFGAAMANVLGGLLQPAADAFGIFDLWGTTLQVLFLPIMEKLSPILIKVMETIIALPEPIKLLIGATAVLGFVFGTLLMAIGSLTLGILGLTVFGGALGAVFTAIGVAIGFLLSPIGLVIAAVVAIYIAFKTNLFGIRDLFTGLWDWLKEWGGKVVTWAFDIGKAIVQGIIDGIKSIGHKIKETIDKLRGKESNSGNTENNTTVLSPTYNITGTDKNLIQKFIENSQLKILDDIKRMAKKPVMGG